MNNIPNCKRRERSKTKKNEINQTKKKLEKYSTSLRCKNVVAEMDRLFSTKRHFTLDSIMKHFSGLNWKQPPSESELKFLIGTSNTTYTSLGQYIVKKETPLSYVKWLEENNSPENLQWSPILLARPQDTPSPQPPWPIAPPLGLIGRGRGLHPPPMGRGRGLQPLPIIPAGPPFSQILERLGKVHGVELGAELDVDGWRGGAAFWVAEVDLEEVKEVMVPEVKEEDLDLEDVLILGNFL